MNIEDFQNPQRQSAVGILIIFSDTTYRFFRAFWGIFVVFLINPSTKFLIGLLVALAIMLPLALVYSYFYYRRFLFHINIEDNKFVLEKGVFSTKNIQISFDKIQQVDLKRSILQRVIGIYGVSIDTAGSKDEEIKITALNQEKAQALSKILTRARDRRISEIRDEEEGETLETGEGVLEEELWKHKLSLWALIKIGLTKSYMRGFLLIIVFVFSIYNQIQDAFSKYMKEAVQYSESYITEASKSVLFVLFLLVGILILSIVVTVGEVIIKHFDLKIQQTPKWLQVEMGLKTNTRVSFQARRLQYMKITTNPIQKRFDLYEAQMALAGSENKLEKSNIVVPGLDPGLIDKIKSFLYSGASDNHAREYKPHRTWPNRRYMLFSLIPLFVWTMELATEENPSWTGLIVLAAVFFLFILPYQYFLYKTIRMRISDDFLLISQGIWTQKQEIIELYKLGGISIRQPIWYKRRNIYNLTFHTAGGDISIRAIPAEFIREINYSLYKIESSAKPWM